MKQRIILTIPNAVFSGSERQLLILGNGLKNYGYDVFFCVLGGKGKIEDEIKNLSLKYFIYSDVKSYFKKLTFYIKIIKQVNPDVIISFNWSANNYTRIAKIVTPSCKFIHIAGERGRGMKNEKIKNFIDRFLHNKSDRIISNSFNQKLELIKYEKIKPQKIDVIFNGLRLNEEPSSGIEDIRNKFLKDHFQKIICTASNFSDHKNIPLMLDSLELLFNKTDKILFLFVGDSRDKQQYVDYVNNNDLLNKNIKFLGYLDDPLPIFLASDLFLFTSIWEGMPNVLIEAMSCGLPIITTPFDGSSELIKNDNNGFILEGFDKKEIVNLIMKVINEDKTLEIIRENAVNTSQKFSIDNMVQAYIKIIEGEKLKVSDF